jgi:hypothetical protein
MRWGCRCFLNIKRPNINRPIHSGKLFLGQIGHDLLVLEDDGDQEQSRGFDQPLSTVRRSLPYFAQPVQLLPKGALPHKSPADVLTEEVPSRSAEGQISLIKPMSKRGY